MGQKERFCFLTFFPYIFLTFFLFPLHFFKDHSQFPSPSAEWGSSTSSPVQFCICRCALLLNISAFAMTEGMKGKTPYLLPQLCLIPCFPLPTDIFSYICLCCTQLSLPSHLERQCYGGHIPFKFILRNTATWFFISPLKRASHLYTTCEDYTTLQGARKNKGRTRNLLQLSPEFDMFVSMSRKTMLESTAGLKDL